MRNAQGTDDQQRPTSADSMKNAALGAPGLDSETWETANLMCYLECRSLQPGSFEKLPHRDNGNSIIVANPQQMSVSADDKIGVARDGAFQNAIVVRVVGN